MIVIVTTGGSCVGELLKVNNSLQKLVMLRNPFGDDGMSSVADGLYCNNTLTMLDVHNCEFSVKGTTIIVVYWILSHFCFSFIKSSQNLMAHGFIRENFYNGFVVYNIVYKMEMNSLRSNMDNFIIHALY